MPVLDELLGPYPQVRIVLSTSWVRSLDFNRARQQLSPALQQRVVGATFHSRHMRKDEFSALSRGVQIAHDVYRRQPAEWFAIDDEYQNWPTQFLSNYIQTNPGRG